MTIRNNLTNEKPSQAPQSLIIVLGVLFIIILSMNLSSAALIDNLVSYWTFNETTGKAIDLALGINNGSVTGTTRGEQGILNSSYKFDGIDDTVQFGNDTSLNFGAGDFSIQLWVNATNDVGTNKKILIKGDGGVGGIRYEITAQDASIIKVNVDDNSIDATVSSAVEAFDSLWHHIVMVRDGNNLRLYIDGVEDANSPADITGLGDIDNADINLTVGNTEYNGTLDEIGMWNRALSDGEVSDLYNNGNALEFPLITFGVVLNVPGNNTEFTPTSQNFNVTVVTGTTQNITNITFSIWHSNGTLFNESTRSLTGTISNDSIINIGGFPLGNFKWNVLAHGRNSSNAIITAMNPSNFTFSRLAFAVEQEAFPFNVFETESIEFLLNISTVSSILSVDSRLFYNGTSFPASTSCNSTGFCQIGSTIDIPLVAKESQNKTFFWNISVFDGTSTLSASTTQRSHNVSMIHFQECDATFTVQALNFTSFDELDNTRIDPFYIAGTVNNFWLGGGNVKRNNAFSNISTSEFDMCISPVDRNFTIEAEIEYNEVINSTTFNTRNYFFQDDIINNQTQHIGLFLLNVDDSTSFILKVQDTNLLPVSNALIIIQKLDLGTGNFTTVQIAKTDDNGQSVGFFKTETVDYRFIIKKNGVILLQTSAQKVVPETAPFTLTFTVGVDEGAPWEKFEVLANLTQTLAFNSVSTNVTFTYVDTSGEFASSRLLVIRQNLNGSSPVICDINSGVSSAISICGTLGVPGTYIASAFITRGSETFLVNQILFKVETFSSVAGLLGVFLAWFIILISAFAFKFNEIAGIVLINIAVIMVNLIGLVNFGFLFVFGLMGASIMIIVLLKK